MALTSSQRALIAAVAAAVVGTGALQVATLPLVAVAGLAGATFLGIVLGLPADRAPADRVIAPGVTAADAAGAADEGQRMAGLLETAAGRLPAADPARATVLEIAVVVRQVYGHLAEDPADIPRAHGFRNAHLPTAVALIESCARLASGPNLDAEAEAQLQRTRERLHTVREGFVAQLNALRRQDLDALEAAGRYLEGSLRIEHGLDAPARDKP